MAHIADTYDDLTVSLERHLLQSLRNVQSRLSPPLSGKIAAYTSPSSSSEKASDVPTIPYKLLLNLSQWARSPAGLSSLKEPPSPNVPPLDPADYTIISLLAGTTTSPNRRFPAQAPTNDLAQDAKRQLNDRRAIVAVINALLSVAGTGGAVWWAAGSIGWRDEWRVLLSFLAAAVVAFSEIVLYIIWESRRNTPSIKGLPRQVTLSDKKDDGPAEPLPSAENASVTGDGALRRRIEPKANMNDENIK